jgi:hypothetical protein
VYGLIFKEGPPTRKECEILRNAAPVGMMPENCEDHVQELIDCLLNEEVLRGALKVECNFAIHKNKVFKSLIYSFVSLFVLFYNNAEARQKLNVKRKHKKQK